nr:Xaa-Pro peptidase family protein [uncultured Porphyromonas sp.]
MLHPDYLLRQQRLQSYMQEAGIDALVLSSNVALLYVYGQVFAGLAVLLQQGEAHYFVRRPQTQPETSQLHHIRKIEQLPEWLDLKPLRRVALEQDEQSYSDVQRMARIFEGAEIVNATPLLRRARMVKTPLELEQLHQCAARHVAVYREVPKAYREGMTDRDLQIELERVMRQHGSVGLFRCFGSAMEIFMGSLLAGDNAGTASPYDFALGGAGTTALPLGANGTPLTEGTAVMVDMAGNYGVYYSDLTRTYSVGQLPAEAYRLHELSRQLHREVMQTAGPGSSCAELYTHSLERVTAAGAADYFMGTELQAQFVGHGIGLQINEPPVLTPRSRDVLEPGMVIAFEPKFVLPGVGAIGIENSYLVTETGVENLTPAPEEIIDLRTGLAHA